MRTTATIASTAAAIVVSAVALSACAPQSGAHGTPPTQTLPATPVADQLSSSPSAPAATPYTPPATTPTVRPTPAPLHFDSPEAAMRYLAAAYDRGDLEALRPVTTPGSRADLWMMRSEAVNLQLDRCTSDHHGGYLCEFTHDYPKSLHMKGHGSSTMAVLPAARPGWYMSGLLDCG